MIHCLSGRVLKPEIMDTLLPEDARDSLADLVRINAKWGGYSALRKLLDDSIPAREPFSLLDIGAASGDMGRQIRNARPGARITSLDYIPSHLAAADQPKLAADAFALPFAPKSFDYVFCSLFLHHFTDAQVTELLHNFAGLARKKVLVIDLWRHPVPYYFIGYTSWLFGWHPVSVYDGKISVEAAFTPRELTTLAAAAGLKNVQTRTLFPGFRIALHGGAA